MKRPRSDDLIPEEEPSARPDLVPLLRQVYQQSAPLSTMEQEQMLAQALAHPLRAELGASAGPGASGSSGRRG